MEFRNYKTYAKIYGFYKENEHCDLILIAEQDGTRIPTHRLVISAASKYFESMFTTSMKDKDMKEVRLGDVSGQMLKNLIEYCYTGQFPIDAENVSEILRAAANFRFVDLVAECSDFLKDNVNNESCFTIWNTAKLFDLHELTSTVLNYICGQFMTIVETDGFRKLKSDQLIEILLMNEIAVNSEEDVFNSIIKWIEFDAENRRGTFEKLIPIIRMSKISHEFFVEQVLRFLKDIGRTDLFFKVWEHKDKCKEFVNENSRDFRGECIYAISRDRGGKVITIQRYNQTLNSWEVAYTFNEIIGDLICNNNEKFLIVGNLDNKATTTNKVQSFPLNALKPILKDMKPMKYGRSYSASAKLFGFIYVTGGCARKIEPDVCNMLPNVECLDLKTMEWTELPPLQQKRAGHSIAVLSGKLYVSGGWDEARQLHSVERYDPQLASWTTVSPMNVARDGHRCVVANNILYAIGGCDNQGEYMKSIEKYDEVADKWTLIEMEICIPRADFGALVLNNWIFLGGGATNDQAKMDDFEKINVETGERVILQSLPRTGDIMHFAYIS